MNMHTQTPREYAQECVDTLDEKGLEEMGRWGTFMLIAARNFKCPEWIKWFKSFEYWLRVLEVDSGR